MPGGIQHASRMKREFKTARNQIAGALAVDYGAIEPPRCSEGAAGVAVPLRPMRPQHQHALVCRSRRFVPPAIAEYPGADIRDLVALGLQIKRSASALDRLVKTFLVIERRAQAAIEPCPLVVREIATSETMTAFLDLTRIGRAYRRLTNFIDIAQPDGTLNAVYG